MSSLHAARLPFGHGFGAGVVVVVAVVLHSDSSFMPAPVSKSSTAEIALAHWLSGRLNSTGLALTASLFASSAVKSQISMV